MKITLKMPKLSPDMKSAVLCGWLKEQGDKIKAGEGLFDAETEKVVSTVEATSDCLLVEKLAEEGDEVAEGAAIAVIELDEKA